MIDRQTQAVKFKTFAYASVLTKGGKPLLALALDDMNNDNDDSSRIDTSRTDDMGMMGLDHDIFGTGINSEGEYLFRGNDHFKLKRYEEKYSY